MEPLEVAASISRSVDTRNDIRRLRGVESVSADMVTRQIALVSWDSLRTGGGTSDLGGDLMTLLKVVGQPASDALHRMENAVVSQGHLFECAPSVVSVVMSGLAERSIPEANLGAVLDLLCRILVGFSAQSEVDAGNGEVEDQCRNEALKGYWSLMSIAVGRDAFDAWKLARDALEILDAAHAVQFVE